jgi:DnaJ-domain-containing protein 1
VVRDDREADAIRERVRQRMERGQPDALSGTVVSPARRPPAP